MPLGVGEVAPIPVVHPADCSRCKRTPLAYILSVASIPITVVELPLFQRQAVGVWGDAEREAFVDFIARNPEAGDVIPETGRARKLR